MRKANVLRLTAVAVVCAAALLLSFRGSSQQQGKQTVEQTKQNIQVLKGMPASQLSQVMNYFAASLGVQCEHCHVIDSTGWYMEKDDKPAKQTARRMIQMVKDLNATQFGGKNDVTCYTCHHGSLKPADMIPLPQTRAPGREEEGAVAALPTVDQLLNAYEAALGGAAAMKAITSRVSTGTSADPQGREMPLEVIQEVPDKYVATVTMREGMMRSAGYDGKTGWVSSPRGTRALSAEESEQMKKDAALFPLSNMRKLAGQMRVLRKESINGAPAFVLETLLPDGNTEQYFIDSASSLLVRKVVVMNSMVGNIPEQTDYSEYKTVDGVKVPFVEKVSSVDVRNSSNERLTSVKQNVPIDKKKFVMPEVKEKKN